MAPNQQRYKSGVKLTVPLSSRNAETLIPWGESVMPMPGGIEGDDGLAEALLGRGKLPVYGPEARDLVYGQTVLVTGAGGSIGSEIVRQVSSLGAGRTISVDRDEYALYRLQLTQTGRALLEDESLVLADVTSREQMGELFARFRPSLVFHAAACKHLPLLERAPAVGILTNVGGTDVIASLAARYNARLVNISTDKAARPVSVLGATKRLAEAIAAQVGPPGIVASVRFGNVFGSRGSFIETMTWQMKHDLPVTITHPAMRRFFMTVTEAVGLVIEAAVMANGSSIFVLDMGKPYSIVAITERYAQREGVQASIMTTGARQGEKVTEDLTGPTEVSHFTGHPLIMSIPVGLRLPSIGDIRALCVSARDGASREDLRDQLGRLSGGEFEYDSGYIEMATENHAPAHLPGTYNLARTRRHDRRHSGCRGAQHGLCHGTAARRELPDYRPDLGKNAIPDKHRCHQGLRQSRNAVLYRRRKPGVL
jgi:nucleoside-diphosphate-sugar epimerase